MSFEHASEMYAKYVALGKGNICTPLSIDASLHDIEVPESFYPENNDLFLQCHQEKDPVKNMEMGYAYNQRLIAATFGNDSPTLFGMDKTVIYTIEGGQGNPFNPANVAEEDAEFESPLCEQDDLEAYIAQPSSTNRPVELDTKQREDRVRQYFVLSRMILQHHFTVNFEITLPTLGNHQIGLRQEDDDEFYFVNSMIRDQKGLLRKIGPLTLREICGISQDPWSGHRAEWPLTLSIDLVPLFAVDDGVMKQISHIYPPEKQSTQWSSSGN